jgi:hypothetical protein
MTKVCFGPALTSLLHLLIVQTDHDSTLRPFQ